ncbi:MAG: hypothetical protein ACD_46C00682G0002 [uncultured bacterium]|nr:MAG: hypothetical protein ACD_46C00682G0002 [uncultured bacterium]
MKKMTMQIFFSLILILGLCSRVFADSATGFGEVAQNLMSPVGLMSDFVYSGCLIVGGSFIFAAIIKYFEHRNSPLMVPISTVVFLFIAGLALLALPLLSLIDANAMKYSLFQ